MMLGIDLIRSIKRYNALGQPRGEKMLEAMKALQELPNTQLEAYNILKDDPPGSYNYEASQHLKIIMQEHTDALLHRFASDPVTKETISRLRQIYTRLTGDYMPGGKAIEGLSFFQLSHDHVPEGTMKKADCISPFYLP
jgi:hypothetical protein